MLPLVRPPPPRPDVASQVVLCSNTLQLRKEYFQVIIHELIHAYDKCRAEVDWNNCLHHACTEVRACRPQPAALA